MAKASVNLTQFNGGLLCPKAEGRTNLDIYPYHCRQLYNTLVDVYGNAFWRGGMAYIDHTKDNGEAFLVPFQVSETISYMLEFGDGYIRFSRNRKQIKTQDEAGNWLPYEIVSPYTLEDLKDESGRRALFYTQSADILFLCHPKHPPMQLMRYGDTDWRLAEFTIKGGPWQSINTDKNKIITADKTSGLVTLTTAQTMPVARMKAISNGGVTDIWVRWYIDGIVATSSGWQSRSTISAPEVLSVLLSEVTDLNGHIENSEFVITAVNNINAYAGKTIRCRIDWKKTSLVTGYNYSDGEFSGASSSSGVDIFTQDMLNIKMRLFLLESSAAPWEVEKTIIVGDIRRSDGKYYKATSKGTTGTGKPVHTEGIVNDGGVSWEYIHSGYGSGTIVNIISPTEAKILVDEVLPENISTYKWQLGIIGDGGIYPSCITFFKDRLVLGINSRQGPNVCFSVVSDYNNFSDYIFGEILPESGFTQPLLAGGLNAIKWLAAEDMLFVGTLGGILAVTEITLSDVFGPDNSQIRPVSDTGGCAVEPITRNSLLYLDKHSRSIQEFNYNSETESYDPDELSTLAANLFVKGIKNWAFRYEPDRIIWSVRFDGLLIGFTYNKKQVVRAFHLHGTKGFIEDCAVISGNGNSDELWLLVRRQINGQTVRYFEVLDAALPEEIPAALNEEEENAYLIKNAFLADSGIKQTFAEPATVIEGLEHLEGEEVEILTDGMVHRNLTVSEGKVELDYPATTVTTGLNYPAIFEPLPMDIGSTRGTSQAKVQKINEVTLRLYRTAHLEYSHNNKKFYQLISRTGADKTDIAVPLKNGDYKISWGGDYTSHRFEEYSPVNATGARMVFRKTLPLPACIVSIAAEVTTNDK